MKMLESHYDIHSTTNPGKFSNTMSLPVNVVSNLFSFVAEEELTLEAA